MRGTEVRLWARSRVAIVLAMLTGSATCGHSCGPHEDYDAPECKNLVEGGPCSLTSVSCEEKVFANLKCNVEWRCAIGTWQRVLPKVQCTATCPPAYTLTNSGACDGASALPPTSAAPLCEYTQGICGCTAKNEWTCVGRSVSGGDDGELDECPKIRPASGSKRCPSDDHFPQTLRCDYGDNVLLGASVAECRHYSWTSNEGLGDEGLKRR